MFFYNFFHKKEKYPNRENKVKAGRHCLFMLFSSVQSLSCVRLFAIPWTAAHQASLSITNPRSLLKLMSIELGMPSNISSSVVHFSSCLQSFPTSGAYIRWPIQGLFNYLEGLD